MKPPRSAVMTSPFGAAGGGGGAAAVGDSGSGAQPVASAAQAAAKSEIVGRIATPSRGANARIVARESQREAGLLGQLQNLQALRQRAALKLSGNAAETAEWIRAAGGIALRKKQAVAARVL